MTKQLRLMLAVITVTCFLCAGSSALGHSRAFGGDMGCVTHAEYDALEVGDSLQQVRNLFDIQGRLELQPNTPNFVKYSFNPCNAWDAADGKRVWTWFQVDSGLLQKWALRDESFPNALSNKGGDWSS